MLVSIIIPTYNRSALLKEAILSCIHQSYRPIECIVVDDGSTDNTRNLVNELIEQNTSSFTLKYVHQQNNGSQVARNTGTAAATGEYIQYLDSDDLLYPDKIKSQVIYLSTNRKCDGVFGDWKTGSEERNETISGYLSDNLVQQFLTERPIHTLSFLLRRNAIARIGDWDTNIKRNQEIDFHLRGVLAGCQYAYQPQVCGLWRIHNGERIAGNSKMSDVINFYKKWETILIKEGKFNNQLSIKISDLYLWLVAENKNKSDNELIPMLKEAIRLNPVTTLVKSRKYKILKLVLGEKTALKIWLWRFRQSTKMYNK